MSRGKRILVLAAVALVGLGTAYSLLLGVLWRIEASHADATTADLKATLSGEKHTVAGLEADVADLTTKVEGNVSTIDTLANGRAQAQDDVVLYGSAALSLGECARERAAFTVNLMERRIYPLYLAHSYEDDINKYCDGIHAAYVDMVQGDAAS